MTSGQLAAEVDSDERYVREWLVQQAVAELLGRPNPDATPEERRYEPPDATVTVLLETTTPAYLRPVSHLAVGALLAVPAVEEAFRTGGGADGPDDRSRTGRSSPRRDRRPPPATHPAVRGSDPAPQPSG